MGNSGKKLSHQLVITSTGVSYSAFRIMKIQNNFTEGNSWIKNLLQHLLIKKNFIFGIKGVFSL